MRDGPGSGLAGEMPKEGLTTQQETGRKERKRLEIYAQRKRTQRKRRTKGTRDEEDENNGHTVHDGT